MGGSAGIAVGLNSNVGAPSTPLSPMKSPMAGTTLTPLGEVAGASGARSVVR